MNSRNLWRFAIVVLITAWAITVINPPNSHPLLEEFENRVSTTRRDKLFEAIVTDAKGMQATNSAREFGNLLDAVNNHLADSTTNLSAYFPDVYVKANEQDTNKAVLNRLQRDASGKIKRGLDLQGGISVLVGVDFEKKTGDTNAPAAKSTEDNQRVLAQAIEVLRKRVDKLGVAEPVLMPAGNDRILIQMPGLAEADKSIALTNISRAAYLEFRMVHPQSSDLINQGVIDPGFEVLYEHRKGNDGNNVRIPILVNKKAEKGLTGAYVKSASPTIDPMTGQPAVSFRLNTEGALIFGEITKDHVGEYMAIVLDGEVQSAPRINGPITGGSGQITGNFDRKEAYELANVLENPLARPVKVLEIRQVSASLGQDAVNSGLHASVMGVVFVAGFMLVYYMFSGLVANIALIINIIITLGVMVSVGTTLTLPGIAGIVLTVGMAVDANVLIYERIREELAHGKSMAGAISAGYGRAFSTIFDSHVTTLISSVILMNMGTGSVKGFGVTLTIGVAASLFTALVVTRMIFDFMLERNLLKSLRMLHVPFPKIDFMKFAKPAFITSWLIIVIGMSYGGWRGKSMFGVEFVGGNDMSFSFAKKVEDIGPIRESITKLDIGEVLINYEKDVASGKESLHVIARGGQDKEHPGDKGDVSQRVDEVLKTQFKDAGFKLESVSGVGATVGKEIQKSAIAASLLSLLGILFYVAVRYEFSFAVGAVVAVIHDVFMTIGCYCLAGREVDSTTVAAILTIIGFSINDTIVIFDRIREDLKLGIPGSFRDLLNQALNQTLSRTLITSGTVLLATLSLYFFGGPVINNFAFTFLVGVITGTYSSIYIASALVLWWHKGKRPDIGSTVQVSSVKESVPARV